MGARICLFLLCGFLLVLPVGVGAFLLTRPGIQKYLVERYLPDGSSVRSVRILPGSLEMSGLKLALPDGATLQLDRLDTDFEAMAALFGRTVKLGALDVDALTVDLPRSLIASAAPVPADRAAAMPSQPTGKAPEAPARSQRRALDGSLFDALYAVGQLGWRFDIESIRLNGTLRDAVGSRYALKLDSGAIRPGEETTVEADLKLLSSREALYAGVKDFDASLRLLLKQNQGGGLERMRLESEIAAMDEAGRELLAVTKKVDLSLEKTEERGTVAAEFNASLMQPEIFLPELAGLGPITAEGVFVAKADGVALTLEQTDFLVASGGEPVAKVDLKKPFTLGGAQWLSGDLMEAELSRLSLSWLAPYLPKGLALSGPDLSMRLNLSGLPDGSLELRLLDALRLGPLTLTQSARTLLRQITVVARPILRIAADGSVSWDSGAFQLIDHYGGALSGQSTGRFDASIEERGILLAGLSVQTKLEAGLKEIPQQPLFEGLASITGGRLVLDLTLDPGADYPARAQGELIGFSTSAYPGRRQDYRFALQLNEPQSGELALAANLQAGPLTQPSTHARLTGRIKPGSEPLAFKANLTALRITQQDINSLAAAFSGDAASAEPGAGTPAPLTTDSPAPPWASLDAEFDLSVDEFILSPGGALSGLRAQAKISEPLLELSHLEAALGEGRVSGAGAARYSRNKRIAYSVKLDLGFENVNPAVFSRRRSKSFLVQGLFDGEAKFSGAGKTLESAIEATEGDLTVTGREGALTAFDLDDGSRLGLIGASLLGQQLNRPGISALAQAAPYFNNVPFNSFVFKLTRGSDKRILVPELNFTGRNLLINGSGSIAATSLRQILDQPLDLRLEFGARGGLIDHLETLQLLGPEQSKGGFRLWKSPIHVGGALRQPDTSALQKLLNEAAHRALTDSGDKQARARQTASGEPPTTVDTSGATAAQENLNPKKKSQGALVSEPIETALDLFNTILGD